MSDICLNKELRVRSEEHTGLDMLLITLMAAMPFLPYVLSAAVLIFSSASILIVKHTRNAVKAHSRMYTIVIAITLLSLVSSLISKNMTGVFVTLGIFLVLTFATYARTVMNKTLFKRVIHVNCIGTVVSLAVVIVQRLSIANPDYRPTGFAYNANYLGSVSVLSALLALIAFLEKTDGSCEKFRVKEKAVYLFTLLANVVIILICESRSSLLGIMGGVFVILLLRKNYLICALFAVGGIGVWVLGYFYPDVFGWANSLVFSVTQRFGIWMCALDKFSSSPLNFIIGIGPMGYRYAWKNGLMSDKWLSSEWLVSQKYLAVTEETAEKYIFDVSTANHAHNIVADTLINVGLLGALLYLVLFRSFLRNAFKKLKSGDKTAFITTLAAIVAVLVQGIPDVTIMWHQTATLFVLMCASSYTEKV